MTTLYLVRLLVAAALVSASKAPPHPDSHPDDLDAAFCTDCKWKQMGFTCGVRVQFLVDHYKMKEEEVR